MGVLLIVGFGVSLVIGGLVTDAPVAVTMGVIIAASQSLILWALDRKRRGMDRP